MILDSVLLFGYMACFLCSMMTRNKERAKCSFITLLGAFSTFVIAEFMINIDTPYHWFHLTVGVVSLFWVYAVFAHTKHVFVSLFICAFAMFQFILAGEGFVFPHTETQLSRQLSAIAAAFHICIMLAATVNGNPLYTHIKRRDSGPWETP